MEAKFLPGHRLKATEVACGHFSGVWFLSKGFSKWQVFLGKTTLLVCFLEVFVALKTLPLL